MADQAVFVGLVPARGGSKRIPRKNLTPCGGKPLIAHTIAASLASRKIARTIVSTDDREISEIAQGCGAEVPFIRPAEISDSNTPMVAVMRHALDWLRKSDCRPTAIVLLQPTSPLRTGQHIDEAIALFQEHPDAESVCSVVEPPHIYHPLKMLKPSGDKLVPYIDGHEQIAGQRELPIAYARNGPAVLVVRPPVIDRGEVYGDPCIPYVMPAEASIDVDEWHDLQVVNAFLAAVSDTAG